jgi:hypothetical protein
MRFSKIFLFHFFSLFEPDLDLKLFQIKEIRKKKKRNGKVKQKKKRRK